MTNSTPCPTCAKLSLWQRLFKRAPDAEAERDLRDAAKEHIETHARGLARGEASREVREIAGEVKR